MFSLRFWGVRGSIPCPGRDTLIFGGNTSCIEIRIGKRLFIVDMGTGIKALADSLSLENNKSSNTIDIFITHTHWDHIMGFPLFSPIFDPNKKITIWGPSSFDNEELSTIIKEQLSYKYWPVRLKELAADISFKELKECSLDLGDGLALTSKFLNHSIFCLAYRFEYMGKSIVCAFDHEPFRNLFPDDPSDPSYNEAAAKEGEAVACEENKKILDFYKGADILIHDTQFLPEEFSKRLGWGHSSYDYSIEAALQAGVKKLIFFHHDPARSDEQLQLLEEKYIKENKNKALEILMAREELFLEV